MPRQAGAQIKDKEGAAFPNGRGPLFFGER